MEETFLLMERVRSTREFITKKLFFGQHCYSFKEAKPATEVSACSEWINNKTLRSKEVSKSFIVKSVTLPWFYEHHCTSQQNNPCLCKQAEATTQFANPSICRKNACVIKVH